MASTYWWRDTEAAFAEERYLEVIDRLVSVLPTLEVGSEAYLRAYQLLAAAYRATEQFDQAARAEAVLVQHSPIDEAWWQETQALAATQDDAALLRRVTPVLARFQTTSIEYARLGTWLVGSYQRTGQQGEAIAIATSLQTHPNPKVSAWATQALAAIQPTAAATAAPAATEPPPTPRTAEPSPAERGTPLAALAIASFAGNLSLASGVTISLLAGMLFVLALALGLILESGNAAAMWILVIGLTILFNGLMFFVSPFIMDLTQRWLYRTRWVSLEDIRRSSPESARVIEDVCRQHKLKTPRLGIIDDQNPTAFTYGSLPNSARLVVSQGLFHYLEDDEAAVVYAHELGHIVNWDFAIMTLAATLVQLTYLIYIFARNLQNRGSSKSKDAAASVAATAYVFYLVGTYLLLYLSRVREYFADHFAAKTTGNPNGLSRALVKIAYGIVDAGQKEETPSRLLEGTRALGIYDAKAAVSTSIFRGLSKPQVERVFLWDLFNPWAWWMELQSTHPLTAKRIRALSTYAEQMGINSEYDMPRVVAEGNRLDKQRLQGSFITDLVIYQLPLLGLLLGSGLGWFLHSGSELAILGLFGGGLVGWGMGALIKQNVQFPSLPKQQTRDSVIELMSDPYASPLRGRPAELSGKIIGRGQAGNVVGSDLRFEGQSGLLYLRYFSRFGPLGNFFFGAAKAGKLIGDQATVRGWFRRSTFSTFDLAEAAVQGNRVTSHPRFWAVLSGGFAIAIGGVLLALSAVA